MTILNSSLAFVGNNLMKVLQMAELNRARIVRAFLLALGIAAPWITGIAVGHAVFGSIASFGSYLLIVSFPHISERRTFSVLLCAALLLSAFAALGASVKLGSPTFFIAAAFAALVQGLYECRGGFMRTPAALGALAFFLSVGQLAEGGALSYAGPFLIGTLWGIVVVSAVIIRASDAEDAPQPINLGREQKRFIAAIVGSALLGGAAASIVPSTHPCWLPAASMRVIKPTRQETWQRMKQRGLGSLLGAAFGGLVLGLYTSPLLHALMMLLLVFTMLLIGSKRYAVWTFCLTAVVLTFVLAPGSSVLLIAADRVLLTVGGLGITALAWFGLSKNKG